jgi:hypothetical protein
MPIPDSVHAGDATMLAVNIERLHFFDRDSGLAMNAEA